MLKTNEKQLVMQAVQGRVAPGVEWSPFEISHDGELFVAPSTGSITYNVKVGDTAFGWAADHVEPAVSSICSSDDKMAMKGYNFLPCLGNEVIVISGKEKGAKGIVTGKHGGVEHVMIDFSDTVLNTLNFDDRFLIKTYGQGLRLLDYPDIHVYNLDPRIFKKWAMRERAGKLEIPVTTIVPAKLMGSGIGSLGTVRGDYDITTQDAAEVKKYKIDKIRVGDFVAITDADNRYGRSWKSGAISIGIVVHCDSYLAGHGPGVMTLLTTKKPLITPIIDQKANIANVLKIGRQR